MRTRHFIAAAILLGTTVTMGGAAQAAPPADTPSVADHWTAERRAAAIPRDLFLDDRGLGYTRGPDGTYIPYGHDRPFLHPALRADSTGGSGTAGRVAAAADDTEAPVIANLSPCAGDTIGGSARFSATVTDNVGVRSVDFEIQYPNGTSQRYAANAGSGGEWYINFSGFTNGAWGWKVVAADTARRGGNRSANPASGYQAFTVDTANPGTICGTGTPPPPSDGVVANGAWSNADPMKASVGRIYFELPQNRRKTRWAGYVCSGTALTDAVTTQTVIVTAAHCTYDDSTKSFPRNVLFIPDQDASGTATDTDCTNDAHGCWAPTAAVVDVEYTVRTFPENNAWDYAFYVVDDTNFGASTTEADLDDVVGGAGISFSAPTVGDRTYALGYSYDQDPDLRYCAEDLGTSGSINWWLGSCEMTGGSSGGPWVQSPDDAGVPAAPVMSVNSWGYTSAPGMAGPKLSGTSASCLHRIAAGLTPADAATAGGVVSGVTVNGSSCSVL